MRFIAVAIFMFFILLLPSCNSNYSGKKLHRFFYSSLYSIIKLTPQEQILSEKLNSIFLRRHKFAGFNGSVLVARKGRILYKNNFGYEKYDLKKELNDSSLFQLASTSKPLTAIAILKLAEQGKLSINDTLQKFIPEFPYKNITVKLLLSHRSGLPNYMYFMDVLMKDPDTPISNDSVVKVMLNKKPARYFNPNRRFEYNNSNYMLLAYIVEIVSGKSFAQFMHDEIFIPCEMHNSYVGGKDGYVPEKNTTYAYEGIRWKKVKNNYLDGITGDKNIYSTAMDLFKFDRMLYTNKLLSGASIEESYKGRSREKYGNRNYGYGWRLIEEKKQTKIVYHNGWWHGYNSLFFRRPEDETVIIILGNKFNKIVYQIDDVICAIDEFCKPVELEEINESGNYASKEN